MVLWIAVGGACAQPDTAVFHADSTEATDQLALATDEEPDALAPKASLKLLSVGGTGCRPASVTAFYDEESRTASIQFSEYALDLATTQQFLTKNCIINLEVEHERGLTYAVTEVVYRGFANLPAGTEGVLRTDYTWAGILDAKPQEREHPVGNVEKKPWVFIDDVKSDEQKFSDCARKRTMTIRTRLQVTNSSPGRDAHLSLESVESTLLPIELHLKWDRCSGA